MLVFATTQDKDVRGMLALLLPRVDDDVTRYMKNPRGVPLSELESIAASLCNAPVRYYPPTRPPWTNPRWQRRPTGFV